ncbi:OmpP1/FadL family transporter [Actibacterium sp. D379-3]
MINLDVRRAAPAQLCAVACALATLGGPAQATNGYIANGYGGGSKGMAGAGVAVPTGVLGLAQNPAMGMKVGNQAGFCLTTFAPDRSFDVGGAGPLIPGTYDSENSVFFIPCGGANFTLNERSALGLFIFGNGGMNTEYESNPFSPLGGSAPLGVSLEQVFLSVNYTYQVTDQLSFGIAPVFALQRFSATGLETFAASSIDPANVTNNGDDWSQGYGLNMGLLWEPNAQWSFGAAYRSQMDMEEFDKYSGLFAEQGGFDIPAVATLGAAYTPPTNTRLTLTAEYQRIFYGDIPALANSGAVLATPLGADDGPGFGWDDMDVIRVGAIWRHSPKLTLRGGVSYATSFTEGDEVLFNTLAPATPQWHASVGASYKLNASWGLTSSYTHAFEAHKNGANQTPGFGQPISLRMVQDEFAIGMTYKW